MPQLSELQKKGMVNKKNILVNSFQPTFKKSIYMVPREWKKA